MEIDECGDSGRIASKQMKLDESDATHTNSLRYIAKEVQKMNRTEIEAKLNRHRTEMLESCAGLGEDRVCQGITPSRHDSSVLWSAKDHLVHLAGIEKIFNAMIRRHLAGDPKPVKLPTAEDGSPLTREALMPGIHAMNDGWISEHRDKSFSEVVALGQKIRSETLALLGSLTDEQLAEKVPGAVWGDGTVGGILAINADHSHQHQGLVTKALAAGE
jgi:hypothetical protein